MTPPRHAVITDEALAGVRTQIGVEVPTRGQFNEYASLDTIRHFVEGVGDPNPLFSDPEYAAGTRWGGVIAPVAFLFTCMGSYPMGLPGVHGLFGGAEFEAHLPIRAGERILSTVYLSGLEEKRSAFAVRTIKQTWTFVFRNERGDLLAHARRWTMRAERDTAREKGKYREVEPHSYSGEELAAIEAGYAREERRGDRPRYWEDVAEGEELPAVLKGPLTITDIMAWKIGWGFRPYVMAHRLGWEYRERHPALASKDRLGVWDVPERVHWDNDFAREIGAPAAYDYGPQRIAWLGHLMTNWIGDDGFLKVLRADIRRFNIVGDTTWCKGRVARKWVESGEHLVACDVWCENQRGEVTAPGSAVAALPSRGG